MLFPNNPRKRVSLCKFSSTTLYRQIFSRQPPAASTFRKHKLFLKLLQCNALHKNHMGGGQGKGNYSLHSYIGFFTLYNFNRLFRTVTQPSHDPQLKFREISQNPGHVTPTAEAALFSLPFLLLRKMVKWSNRLFPGNCALTIFFEVLVHWSVIFLTKNAFE